MTAKTQEDNYELLGNTFSNFNQSQQMGITNYNTSELGGQNLESKGDQSITTARYVGQQLDNQQSAFTYGGDLSLRDTKLSKEIHKLISDHNSDDEPNKHKETHAATKSQDDDQQHYNEEDFIEESIQQSADDDKTAKFRQPSSSDPSIRENINMHHRVSHEHSEEIEYDDDGFESEIPLSKEGKR